MAYGYRGGAASTKMVHDWANQIGEKKTVGNVFYVGNTIYSYGYHFPMARHLDDRTIAMTTQSYSSSTASHLSAVRSAASHKKTIWCCYLPKYSHDEWTKELHNKNIDQWIHEVEYQLKDMAGKKQQRSRDRIAAEIEAARQQAREYICYFDIKLTKTQQKKLYEATAGDFEAMVKRQQAAEKRKREELIKKGVAMHPVWLEAWRKDGSDWQWRRDNNIKDELWRAIEAVEEASYPGNTRLRVMRYTVEENKTMPRVEVQTSKGICIPVDVAHRYYRKYLAVVKAGGCDNNCDYKMLDYPVRMMSEERLVIGCHDIARSEIDYVAGELGWK